MNINVQGDEYVVSFHYERDLVDAIKMTIPAYARRYDPDLRIWFVHVSYTDALRQIAEQFGGTMPRINSNAAGSVQQKTIKVLYIGKSKLQIASGESVHNGTTGALDDRGTLIWDVIFPEKVMRQWFHAADTLGASTLYGVLGVSQQASSDEIKSGYRRMARQWHPDVCHEDNANDMFIRIGKAYDILSNAGSRARYDAGLRFESMAPVQVSTIAYVPPLRCGEITCKVKCVGSKCIVEEIIDWKDITTDDGQILVTSWRSTGLEMNWVRPNNTVWKKGVDGL